MVGGEAHRVRFLDALPHGDEELVCRLALGVGHDADEIIIRPLKNKFIQKKYHLKYTCTKFHAFY